MADFVLFSRLVFFFFFFNDTATTEIYTLSLHDALPICAFARCRREKSGDWEQPAEEPDRKSTRLNSSHGSISYAVFCLKKKNTTQNLDHVRLGPTAALRFSALASTL